MRTLAFLLLVTGMPHHLYANDFYMETALSVSASSHFKGQDKLSTQVNSFSLLAEYELNDFSFKFDGNLQYDSVYDINDHYSDAARDEYQKRLWLDEAYFSYLLDNWDLSLGYQKVVWGQADDLKVVDIINPLDLKDFILFNMDEYRLSLPMFKAETSLNSQWQVEFIWILDFQANKLPPPGSEFSFNLVSAPEHEPSDSEFGLQLSGFWFNSDISFYAFHGYNDSFIVDQNEQGLYLDYKKESMFGSSFVKPIDDLVLRSELAFFNNRSYNLQDGSLVQANELQALLGLDYLYFDWLFTAQVTERKISGWNEQFTTSKSNLLATLSADATLASGMLTTRVAASYSGDFGHGMLYQTKLIFSPNESWKYQLNIDVLTGTSDNFFGQFSSNDRIWLSTTYLF